jgi:putative ABC transport system permease protein
LRLLRPAFPRAGQHDSIRLFLSELNEAMWEKRRKALDGLDEEIRDHLEREVEISIARGLSTDEAHRQARLAFGNVALVQEDTRAAWTWSWLEQARQDLRFGVRILKNSPGLSFTAAILIALVIGINTTVFTMVNGLVTRPAPGVTADGLVRIAIASRPGIPYLSYPDYRDYATQTTTLQSLTASVSRRVALTADTGSYAVNASGVDMNYFDTIGIRPVRGRSFTASEERSTDAGALVAIVSYRAWQDLFGGAEGIVGRAIAVNDQPATVIGVAPPNFRGTMIMERIDVWLPLLMWRGPMADRNDALLDVIGRLAPGQSVATAQVDFSTIWARLNRSYPIADRPAVAVVRYAATAGGVAPAGAPMFLAIFSVITLLTVLIVSANVANLMLSRAVARQRETAVRQSLGASRFRIVRLLLAEGLSISLVAWLAACLMTLWASRAIPRLLPDSPLAESGLDFTPDWSVVAYAMVLAAIGTIAFSLAPALRVWRQDALPWLKAGEHSVAPGRSRLSNVLVVLQLAFSVVLLTLAGLATRSASLMALDLGFDSKNLLLFTVRTTGGATTRETNLALIDRIRERLRSVPGVEQVSYVRSLPPFSWSMEMVRTTGTAEAVRATLHVVGPDYFPTMGRLPTTGRALTVADREQSGAMAVINQNLADVLWPGQNPLGKTMSLRAQGFRGPSDVETDRVEVAGVVPNAFFAGFNPERPNPRPNLIFITEQRAFEVSRRDPAGPGEISFYIRHGGSALESVASALGPVLREVDPRVAIVITRTMDAQLEGVTFLARMIARLLLIFSVVSLSIAAIGQYAVIAFNMRRRVREFGVRIALGASSRQVLSTVLTEGFALTAIGLAAGLLLSLGVAIAVRGALFGVTPTDPWTYAGVFALLGLVALVACCVPARAATRVDPVTALRQE